VKGRLQGLDTGIDIYYNCADEVRFIAKRADHASREISRLRKEIKVYRELEKSSKQDTILSFEGKEENEVCLMLFLPYMEKGSVKQFLTNNYSPGIGEVRNWILSVTTALAWLHSKNIIWNGCSAKHVLLDNALDIRISGFGSSRRREKPILKEDDIMRELRWKAPEVVQSFRCRRRSDIWSLGCLVVEMLSGTDPHADCESDFGVTWKLLRSHDPRPQLKDGLTKRYLSDFLSLTLKKDASKRRAAEELVLHPFLLGKLED